MLENSRGRLANILPFGTPGVVLEPLVRTLAGGGFQPSLVALGKSGL